MMNLSQFATNSTLQRFRKKLVDLTPVALYPIVRTLTIEALKLGPIPKHISFIMDGNRRYSREQGISIQQGHFRGFLSLKRLLEFLLRLGVSHITVYAFAIDNYRRTAEEIEKLMDMGKSKMLEICERGELFERFGIRVRMVGRVDLLPPDVQVLVARVQALTAKNNRGVINIAFSYSAQEEIASAITQTVQEAMDRKISPSSIDIDTLASHLYTTHTPPLDMLVRSSGVNRISDYLLWQLIINSTRYVKNNEEETTDDWGNHTPIKLDRNIVEGAAYHIVPTHWPNFGMDDMVPIILKWQLGEFRKYLGLTTETQVGNLLK
ncbi:cis-prenyltransferase [Puccinia graminis f. sp. tritici]|uniref:Alkyl transferase n=2 Tax=Puccinia graminis f. sp. tritici TaxID=56615 RepID=E3KQL0_PUCGT|nr:uncharacterized protein PGTG_12967 [Puccinia graminis f. sp. tritici CRL 75-36-700-3]EFP86585.2 hypothetical protein PGTG_12967 [Puccinia graminis f. sp. tritici CRL 75-36-700-3]KAA1111024.1 cis-prenyltransferase [Puccinia graminis f. sp. tritici]